MKILKWIKLNVDAGEMPPSDTQILLLDKDNGVQLGELIHFGNELRVFTGNYTVNLSYITHWMHLPELPKKSKE